MTYEDGDIVAFIAVKRVVLYVCCCNSPPSVLNFPVRLTGTDTSAEIEITSLIENPISFKVNIKPRTVS